MLRLSIDSEEMDHVQTAFPEPFGSRAVVGDPRSVVDSAARVAQQFIQELASLREECAVSGAMRWPWSQEAAIGYRSRLYIE